MRRTPSPLKRLPVRFIVLYSNIRIVFPVQGSGLLFARQQVKRIVALAANDLCRWVSAYLVPRVIVHPHANIIVVYAVHISRLT